jgi:SAM-dependent methyltransferase
VDPDLMFRQYPYLPGTSQTLRDYLDWFARYVDESLTFREHKKVLDIACNDGSQLAAFAARGWQTWGVDPAENLAPHSRATGAQVLCEYWTPRTARELGMAFDSIVAQNVFAHVGDPLAFLEACRLVMDENSKLFIQTSNGDMFPRVEFDTIYHEHVSFFSTLSMRTLARRAGLALEEIFITPIHGRSYVFVLGYEKEGETVAQRIAKEEHQGRYSIECYRRFTQRTRRIVENLKAVLENELRSFRVVGFGAAAKGNTLLNLAQIKLAYIVDNNRLKQGLYTPGMNIPIHPPEQLIQDSQRLAILVLAWNFFDEIRDEVRALRPDKDDVLITYFPEVSVHPVSDTAPNGHCATTAV